jgi:hypothetical protein
MRINQDRSYIWFLYPFNYRTISYDILIDSFTQLSWEGRNKRYPVWSTNNITHLPDLGLLPGINKFLDCESKTRVFSVGSWKLSNEARTSVKSGFGGSKIKWVLEIQKIKEIPFEILAIELFLFKTGVGFLNFQIKLLGKEISSSDWTDFIHYFRFLGGERGKNNQIKTYLFGKECCRPFFPAFLGKGESENTGFYFSEIITSLLQAGCESMDMDLGLKNAYINNYFIPYSYTCVEGADAAHKSDFLSRITGFLNSSAIVYKDKQSVEYEQKHQTLIWKDHYFISSLEGGGMVAFDPPDEPFFKFGIPDHISKHYYLLYLIALQQKFFLTSISENIANDWLIAKKSENNSDDYYQILLNNFFETQESLLFFTSIGNFAQIMHSQHHHDIYIKWREILEIDRLYNEVKSEIQNIYNFLNIKTERINQAFNRRIELSIQGITFIFGFPALLLGFYEVANVSISLFHLAKQMIISSLIGLTIFIIIKRKNLP